MKNVWGRLAGISIIAGALCFFSGCVTTSTPGVVSDRDLADAVSIRLNHDPVTAVCNLMVTAKDGVVYLQGKAPASNMVRGRAVSVALATPGVVEVVDDLYPPTNGVY